MISGDRIGRILLAGTAMAVSALVFSACGAGPPARNLAGQAFGAGYHVRTVWRAAAPPVDLTARIEGVLTEIDRLMSTYREDSEIMRFNRAAAGEAFPLSAATAEVFRVALEVAWQTQGAFDITIGPLVRAYGFGPEGPVPPDPDRRAAARALVGHGMLHLDAAGQRIRKEKDAMFCDLNAIAPGYAADRVAEMLASLGCADYMVEIGGEVCARGRNAEGLPWRIGIEAPEARSKRIQRVVALENRALATSGDYRQFRQEAGRRVSHILDPRSGAPLSHGLASVTVVHPQCVWADAYATAIMVLGPEEGMALAQAQGFDIFMIIHDGASGFREEMTPGFRRLLLP
jgi:thiamine biosynthesis lipoprotein